MKRLICMLLVCLVTSGAFAQEQPPEAERAAVKHAMGYKPSPFTKQLRAESQRKHGRRLQALQELDLPAKFETPFQVPNQNQGGCGSCWAVSGCISVSGAFIAAGQAKGDGSFIASADTVMWCYNTGGCGGDDASTVMRIAAKDGLPINADVGEYVATGRGPCNKTAKRYKIDDWGYADADNDGRATYNEIKSVILAHGVCVLTCDAGALLDGEQVSTSRGRGTNHQIVVVGWDDDKKGNGYSGALLCKNQWGNWGFEHNGQMGYCWLAAFSNGTIAASGSEEVLWCRVENQNPPTPPVPPVPPAPPVPPVPPAPVPSTVTFTIPAYSFKVPASWYSQTVTIPAQTITAAVNQPKASQGCPSGDCGETAPEAAKPTPRAAYARPSQQRQVAPRPVQSGHYEQRGVFGGRSVWVPNSTYVEAVSRCGPGGCR